MCPMVPQVSPVTQLLREWSSGNESAAQELAPLVYGELRRLADGYMRRERADHTLQPTALINEAYIRLVDQKQPEWQSRSQFFRFSARLMRQILVDHARARQAEKRGGNEERLALEEAEHIGTKSPHELTAIEDALTRLATFDDRKAQIIELKFFGGMTEDEMAEALGISVRTLGRELRLAKSWLARALKSPSNGRDYSPIPPE